MESARAELTSLIGHLAATRTAIGSQVFASAGSLVDLVERSTRRATA